MRSFLSHCLTRVLSTGHHQRSRHGRRPHRQPSVEILEDRTVLSSWTTLPSMPTARSALTATTGPDGRIYAIGGFDNLSGNDDEVEAYNPNTNTWATLAILPTGRAGLAAVTGSDGRIYAIGGNDDAGAQIFSTVEAYNASANTWTTVAPLPTQATELAAAVALDGRIYVLGGDSSGFGTAINTAEAYDPSTNTWSAAAPMPTARFGLAAATGPDGRIYAIGGEFRDSSHHYHQLNTVEAYTPSTNSWSTVASLPTTSGYPAAVTGPDGHIYAIGGQDSNLNLLNTVEAYNPSTNMWFPVAPMPTARLALAAATGPDGRIYAIGGSSGNIFDDPLNTAEALTLGADPPVVTPSSNQSAVEGAAQSLNLGSFSDTGAGPWTATVAWGDGTSTTLTAPSMPGSLGNQSHSYAEEGTYSVTVTVKDTGDNASGSATSSVSVSELNVMATPAMVDPTAGAPFGGAVATFTDPGGAEANDGSHYSASINWGDNSATAIGSISLNGSTFSVNGTHTYAAANSYSVTVTISHEGNPILVQSQVMVVSLGQFVSAGMVKPISFWEGLQGQQLVRRFGTTGDGRTLGQWLATTYPNLYGGMGGAPNLSPFTLAQISSYYQSLFLASKGTGLDAEVLATVLEVFATTSSLGGSVGQSFGFTVTNTGLGAESWNIGSSGQAFGVPNLTVLNVYQILLAANNSAVGGEPWGSNPLFRNEAFSVFHGINGG